MDLRVTSLIALLILMSLGGCANYKTSDQAFYDGVKACAESRPDNPDNRVEDKDLAGGIFNFIANGLAKLFGAQ
ncbi:hypothetical protein LZP69_03100 [Shewanella sp. AS1]|uniref:hypothetical protein n=1 Tax=Shewanella sp. AS1 TaxID=2907626 RepID=UPI001F24D854|nr:hypothetical protein [Shewanella sp. AS1]MCE9678184.1 hypothetical protein [Shewanella sp. AS1]